MGILAHFRVQGSRHNRMEHVMTEPTDRHLDILPMIADGLSNGEIGAKLFISEDTVKTHLRKLMKMWGARNRAHLVHCAYQAGILAAPANPAGPSAATPAVAMPRQAPRFERRGLVYRALAQPS